MSCGQACMYNTLRGCTVEEYGGKCPLFNTGDKEHKPTTNADRFRRMTNEEQQKFVRGFWEIEDFADWLQQPVKEGADHE